MAFHPQEIKPPTVIELQLCKFSQMSLQEQLALKDRGRPTPSLVMSQTATSKDKKYVRSFNPDWYKQRSWLCGCIARNKLFCYPCLLYGGEAIWVKDGYTNIGKINEKADKHERTKQHMDNVVSLSFLGVGAIERRGRPSEEAKSSSLNEHNMKVRKNRQVLSKIVDCVFYCGNFETRLHAHTHDYVMSMIANEDSVKPGVFRGLINLASELDSDLKNHLETSRVFHCVSINFQNDVLDCVLQVYREEILSEIRKASFVAVMVEDVTDVSELTRMVLVLRYVLNAEIFERFWGFFIPEHQDADGISECILEQLNIIHQGSEVTVIALSLDGASFMRGKKAAVQEKIRTVYSNVHFIHCYTHQPYSIMRNVVSVTQNARIFFYNVLSIPSFFSRSLQRASVLKKHVDAHNLHTSSTSLNFDIRTINMVRENLEPLKSCVTEIQSSSNLDSTIAEATRVLEFLKDDNFEFWLEFFHQIMRPIEKIYYQMQSVEIGEFMVNEYVTSFKTAILELRNSKFCENPTEVLMAEAKEVCDSICDDIMDRFSNTKHLVAAKLFNKKCISIFQKDHPTKKIILIIKAYPMMNKERLDNELKVFYRRSDIHGYCILTELLKFILANNLDSVFCEITKLLKILLTIPMMTTEKDRCFSTLEKIKSFLKIPMSAERLNAHAVISLEADFLSCHPDMNEKVVNLFSQIETRKMDFEFK